MNKSLFFTSALALLLTTQTAIASAPLSFTYHGLLKEDNALVNGTRTMTATLYDDQDNIIAQKEVSVEIDSGNYSMVIDNIDVDAIVVANQLYLGLKVGDDDELSPRLLVTSVPYSLAARYADTAGDLICDGCISAKHLDFIAADDFTLPSCPAYQVMTAQGSGWVCNDSLVVDNSASRTVNYVKGKIAINNDGRALSGLVRYNKDGEPQASLDTDSMDKCPCADSQALAFECPDNFTSEEDYGPYCYDQFGGAKQLFKRAAWLDSMDDVVVLDGASLGMGLTNPQAPIHLRTTNGLNKYEVIIADLEPAILLEDIDGNNFEISSKNGQLIVSRQSDDNALVPQITIADQQVTISGALKSATANITGNLTVGSLKVGSATIDNGMIASQANIDAGKLDLASLKKLVLEMIYPVGSVKITTNNVNPGTIIGGTWVAWGSGRVPVGVNSSDSDFNTPEKTGGEKTHTLSIAEMPSHTHTQNAHSHTQASHNHAITVEAMSGSFAFTDNNETGMAVRVKDTSGVFSSVATSSSFVNSLNKPDSVSAGSSVSFNAQPKASSSTVTPTINNTTATNQYTGGGNAHNNLQPYITCYMWKRTK